MQRYQDAQYEVRVVREDVFARAYDQDEAMELAAAARRGGEMGVMIIDMLAEEHVDLVAGAIPGEPLLRLLPPTSRSDRPSRSRTKS